MREIGGTTLNKMPEISLWISSLGEQPSCFWLDLVFTYDLCLICDLWLW